MITLVVKIKIQRGQVNSPRPLSRGRLEPGLVATKVYAISATSQGVLVPEWGGVASCSLIFSECSSMGRAYPLTLTRVFLLLTCVH